jgi:hypothetical protein
MVFQCDIDHNWLPPWRELYDRPPYIGTLAEAKKRVEANIVTLFLLFRLALLVEPLERKTERKNYYSHRFMKITANYLKFIATIFLS